MKAALSASLVLVALYGCALFGAAERAQVAGTLNAVEQCQEVGRQAADGGHLKAYNDCMADSGLRHE